MLATIDGVIMSGRGRTVSSTLIDSECGNRSRRCIAASTRFAAATANSATTSKSPVRLFAIGSASYLGHLAVRTAIDDTIMHTEMAC